MSFKSVVTQDGANKYVLPKMKDMKCDVVAFLSPDLFSSTEEDLWADAYRSASYDGALGVYLMPDCHKGYVLPVGGVLVTEDTIVQAGSGYDISCGVVYMKVPGLTAANIADWDTRLRWVREVERRVATGNNSDLPELMKSASSRVLSEVLRYGAKAIGVSADLCERQYIPLPDDFNERLVQKAIGRAAQQLGSVGGGNHFVEMQCDKDTGEVWIMVHCGSRGYGWQTADYFFDRGAELNGLPRGQKEQSWLRAGTPLGDLYWAHHNASANYAIANRHTIVKGVRAATQEVYKQDPEVYFEISHNLVQKETLVLPDGTTKEGFVHRKGSTRAFPAGHPDLRGTKWFKTGHPCLIPGSMLAGAAILFPLEGAYQSGCSVNHGSGRLLSRSKAKSELTVLHDEIDQEMQNITRVMGGMSVKGIVGNCARTPLDECGHVYKDLDEVLSVLESEGIAKVHHRMYPVCNLKGTD